MSTVWCVKLGHEAVKKIILSFVYYAEPDYWLVSQSCTQSVAEQVVGHLPDCITDSRKKLSVSSTSNQFH